jgi:inorganic pyrophosphatase
MNVRVFIQNEAGSNTKHYHDETTLEWKRTADVSLPYPYPYGFIIGTAAEDGCNVDCFVITDRTLKTGQLIECDAVGLMEQFEDGQDDHNVLACPLGEVVEVAGLSRRDSPASFSASSRTSRASGCPSAGSSERRRRRRTF